MKNQSNNNDSNVINRNAASASAKTGPGNGEVEGEFHSFVHDVEDLLKATTSLTGDDLARARAKLQARVLAAKESVEKMSGAIADQARTSAKMTNTYVHAHPWQAMGIGAGLGLIIGLLFTRR